jgi:NadR type nicotinamide-nucleotide adenylyltransferase
VLAGAESTGKTTLAERLAAHYGTVWVPEHARSYLEARGGRFDVSDITRIAVEHAASEDAALCHARRLIVCDTDALVTSVYAELYFGTVPPVVARLADERPADLTLLLDVDVPWVDDGFRDLPHLRAELDALFRRALERRKLSFVRISGDFGERWRAAVAAIDGVLR